MTADHDSGSTPLAAGSNGGPPAAHVRVLPERWAARVSEFIRSAGTAEEATAENRPEMMFSRVYLPTQMNFYSDFNIRSRHFRCIETFFVDEGSDGEIRAVVALEGLRTSRRAINLNLIVARPLWQDKGAYVAALLDGVLREASRYSAVDKLRLTYIYDTSFAAPIGIRLSDIFVHPPAHLPLVEEGRLPNETGKNREAVLLAFAGLHGGTKDLAAAEQTGVA